MFELPPSSSHLGNSETFLKLKHTPCLENSLLIDDVSPEVIWGRVLFKARLQSTLILDAGRTLHQAQSLWDIGRYHGPYITARKQDWTPSWWCKTWCSLGGKSCGSSAAHIPIGFSEPLVTPFSSWRLPIQEGGIHIWVSWNFQQVRKYRHSCNITFKLQDCFRMLF